MNLEQTHDGGDIMVLLPCTEAKADEGGPAIEVYYATGAIAATKSALLGEAYDSNVDTYFLSAKYGIIRLDMEIEPYDQTIEKQDVARIAQNVGNFLDLHDYDVMFSFVDGHYQEAVDEVAYARRTSWDIDTVMLRPCGRSAMVDGGGVLKQIIRVSGNVASAGDVTW